MMEDGYGKQPTAHQESSLFSNFGKLFVHGFVYSLIMFLIGDIILIIILLFTAFLGIIGIVVGFAIFFLVIGGLNHGIAGWLWKIESKSALTSLIGQGVVLGVLMLVFQIPAVLIEDFFPFGSVATYVMYLVVQFLVLSIIYGVLGKQVAIWFKEDAQVPWAKSAESTPWSSSSATSGRMPVPTSASSVGVPTYCPNCRAAFPISQSMHPEETPRCRICGVEIATHKQDSFAEPAQTQRTNSCPYCGAEYYNNEIDVEGFVTCKECGAKIQATRFRQDRRTPPKKPDPKNWDW